MACHRYLLVCLFILCACDDPEDDPEETSGWETLVEGAWELPPAVEGFRCVRFTTDEELFIRAIEPIAPTGTHHASVGIDDAYDGPDGVSACTAADLGDRLIYGAGIGTKALTFPEGTALHIAAGTRLVLNLHLFNPTDAALMGTSGLRMLRGTSAPTTPLGVVLAGSDDFELPPLSETSITGQCTASRDGKLAGLFPHMHTLGVHMRVVLRGAGGEELLHDAPFDFHQQQYRLFDPLVAIASGDVFEVTCTWNNPADDIVGFGAGTRSEMCFAILLRDTDPAEEVACVE